MLKTNVGIEWGLDVEINNAGDIVLMLKTLKLDDDDDTVLFEKTISQATLQNIISHADSITNIEKAKIVKALNNFRGNLV